MSTLFQSNRILFRKSVNPRIPKLFLQRPPSCRSFHATPRSQYLDSVLIGTHSILEGLHSVTGLPWAYTLPLAALAIRVTCVLPFSIHARRSSQKRAELQPLLQAWIHIYRTQAIKEVGHLGPEKATDYVAQKMRQKQREVYARFHCATWKDYLNFIQFPVWLVLVETVRKMCGAHDGLLSWVASLFTPGTSTSLEGTVVEGIESPVIEAGQDVKTLLFEPAFASEGALWFPDLTVMDPHLILPFLLSGALFNNLRGTKPNNKWSRRMTNSLKVLSLAIIPLTLQMPSAMLVYWTSSSLLAGLQMTLIDRLMPIKKPIIPCGPPKTVAYIPRPPK